MAPADGQRIALKVRHELRITVAEHGVVTVVLVDGAAELFGFKLEPNVAYAVRDRRVAVFSWTGATVELSGARQSIERADGTPMPEYRNFHEKLQKRRQTAREHGVAGPRVVVCGPVNTGKSTITKILLNYALHCDEKPIHVDLNVGQNKISVPGTIAATRLDKQCLSVEDESFPLTVPVVYSLGATTFEGCPKQYSEVLNRLARAVKQQLAVDPHVNASGSVITTCGWVEREGYDFLVQTVELFDADIIVVLGNDHTLMNRLAVEWKKKNHLKCPKLYAFSTSSGVLERDKKARYMRRQRRICDYFFHAYALSQPHVKKSVCKVYQLDQARVYHIVERKVSKLFQPKETTIEIHRLDGYAIPQHALLAVPSLLVQQNKQDPPPAGEGEMTWLLSSPVRAFVFVVDVSMDDNTLTLMLPSPAFTFDSQWLVASDSITWSEFVRHMELLGRLPSVDAPA